MAAVMTEDTIGIHAAERLPAEARVGRVRLAVGNLDRSKEFYTGVVGFEVKHREGRTALLGPCGGPALLELEQQAGVQALGRRSRLGLYHVAYLLPTREALGGFARSLMRQGVEFGAGDHLYSEAIYLTDPDGLGVEVYADRARDTWRMRGREIMGATLPVQFAELPEAEWTGAPAGTRVGHVHLAVGDLAEASRFYHETLGMDVVTWSYPGALFVSAGGYHHHVGLNVWAAGQPAASQEDARLLHWELELPSAEAVNAVRARMSAAGFAPVEVAGEEGFRDAWGTTVVPRAAREA